jgi:hypothetical protein
MDGMEKKKKSKKKAPVKRSPEVEEFLRAILMPERVSDLPKWLDELRKEYPDPSKLPMFPETYTFHDEECGVFTNLPCSCKTPARTRTVRTDQKLADPKFFG